MKIPKQFGSMTEGQSERLERNAVILGAYRSGIPAELIGRVFKIHQVHVYRIVKKLGKKVPAQETRGKLAK